MHSYPKGKEKEGASKLYRWWPKTVGKLPTFQNYHVTLNISKYYIKSTINDVSKARVSGGVYTVIKNVAEFKYC